MNGIFTEKNTLQGDASRHSNPESLKWKCILSSTEDKELETPTTEMLRDHGLVANALLGLTYFCIG